MKPTLKDFQAAQKLFLENKEVWETDGKIDGNRGREDGYVSEDLVIRTMNWVKNNTENVQAPDCFVEGLGYGDIKIGSAKRYGGTFWLEIIQNPKTSLNNNSVHAGFSSWTYSGTTDFLAYLDWSDDTFPLYIYDVKKLIKKYNIHQIVNCIKLDHMKYYSDCWSKHSKLQAPRQAELDIPFSCFGKAALGFEISTDLASSVIILSDFLEVKDESGTDSSTRVSGSNKKKTSSSVHNSKKQS